MSERKVRPPLQVFQRRNTGQLDFFKRWRTYVEGFGDPMKEFWLGMCSETPGGLCRGGDSSLHRLLGWLVKAHHIQEDVPGAGTGHSEEPAHQDVRRAMLLGRFSCWACDSVRL